MAELPTAQGSPAAGGRFGVPRPQLESFFRAQRRHRRWARVYTVLAFVAAILQAIPASVLLVPWTFVIGTIVLDLVNLWRPTPDTFEVMADVAREMNQHAFGWGEHWRLVVALVAPGVVLLLLIWFVVRRYLLRSGLGGVLLSAGTREPNPLDLEEHQLGNVVQEMAIAAGIPPPRLLILAGEGANAATFGTSHTDALIVVPRQLLDRIDRRQTEGIVAHLIATIANGDLRIFHDVLALQVSWAIVRKLIAAPIKARWLYADSVRLARGRLDPEREARFVTRLTSWDGDNEGIRGLPWEMFQMFTNGFVVGPFLAMPVRRRRYLADAIAVQLTRDPDGLARGLVALQTAEGAIDGGGYAGPYCVVEPPHGKPGGDSLSSDTLLADFHPKTFRRIRRLIALGYRPAETGTEEERRLAAGKRPPRPRRGVLAWIVAVPVLLVLVPLLIALLLLMFVMMIFWCLLATTVFVVAPALIVTFPVHEVLRHLAGG